MKKYKTRWFRKWSYKKSISDQTLLDGIKSFESGIGNISLGSGLYKLRLAGQGKGKSGGYRTFLVYKKDHVAIYIYGFNKNERENISDRESQLYRRLAETFLNLSIVDFEIAVAKGELIELEE
ncbi:MAG: type II toxin-antitoxin system RelE/ParE family toxin [Desulfamplus sp.]|nr:type II toxin-antitoxin system RelE/ParE family toxin [Desulfamplus sp.]